ncbi:MAG: AGE family epimerase/isomerase [Draconibacterium sp.]|nr:AGE family epimerase/isomerase [Draconibacterium sp.]
MTISKSELLHYKSIFSNELHENILPFWVRYAPEKEGNGFYGAVDLKGNPIKNANKSVVLNARILWTFAAAAKSSDKKEYAEMADRAYHVLINDFEDKKYSGYFMELTQDNQPANDIKHTYAQAFVIYAFCKYFEFRPVDDVMKKIQSFYNLFEEKAKDQIGYKEAFTRDWKLYSENRMADNNEPKSMNTHLHILEAYAALYKVWKAPEVKKGLAELIGLFLDKIIRTEGHLGIFFDESFKETESSKGICSFGHDIEAAWLLWEAAEILDNRSLTKRLEPLVIKMVDNIEKVAIDKHGGIFLESTRFGSHVKTNKHWWQQAETLVGFMNAFQLTGNVKYWEVVKQTWDFINKYLIDHKYGEWFTKLNRFGVPYLEEPENDPSPYYRNDWKIDPWKCPYHNGRAMMEMINRISNLLNYNNYG